MLLEAARVVIPFVLTFAAGLALAPLLTHYLYKHKVWKKRGGKKAFDGSVASEFNRMHEERETATPRMGGILIWGTVAIVAFALAALDTFVGGAFSLLDFVNRGQTWLPLAALILGGIVGLVNDILDVTTEDARGLPLPLRLLVVSLISGFIGWWFYAKLDVTGVGIPFYGELTLDGLFIPFFILVTLAIYAGGIIDGIDGLAGGVFAFIFMTYAGIAFAQEQVALAAFAAALSGSLFAFLWFNIPPARFWMTETGTMGLTLALAVTAFSADVLGEGYGVSVLPIIALPLAATVATSALQVLSKRFFKRKLFRIAPIHHHFEAVGWPSYKVTMRYWVISIIAGVLGLSIALLA